jgi:hypothetical protein
MDAIFGSAKNAIATVAKAAKKLANNVVTVAKQAGQKAVKAISSVASGIKSGASKTIRNISSGIKQLVPWVKNGLKTLISLTTKTIGLLYRKLWGDNIDKLNELWNELYGYIRGSVEDCAINWNPLKLACKYLAEIAFDKYYELMPDEWEKFAEETFLFGFRYDDEQNITYTQPWAPQKNVGYTPIYDLVSRDIGFDIAAQIITFSYGGKDYLIETWKGDYWGAAGCEVGIYSRKAKNFLDKNYFYNAVEKEEQMDMSITLKAGSSVLFTRSENHWWLTGFKPGEYLKPEQLEMEVTITFPGIDMATAFENELDRCGTASEIDRSDNVVSWMWTADNTESIEETVENYIGEEEITDKVYDELMNDTMDELANKAISAISK